MISKIKTRITISISKYKKILLDYSFVSRRKEKFGQVCNYNIFLLYPITYFRLKGHYIADKSRRFTWYLWGLKRKKYSKAIILGNAPCLSEMTDLKFKGLEASGYLSIGLNRSVYSHQTKILMWSDFLTLKDIVEKRRVKRSDCAVIHTFLERNYLERARDDEKFIGLINYWRNNKNFRNWDSSKLYMFRNILIPALHLCYKLNIKDVMLVGFGFDNREYFYKTKKYKNKESYEIRTDKQIEESFGGYDTKTIVRAVIEYLIFEEGFKISYNGDSKFMASIVGIKKVNI